MAAVGLEKQRFSRGEKIILRILGDGRGHTLVELRECLYDDLAEDAAVEQAIIRLRRKLRPLSHDIVQVLYQRKKYYQHVLLLGKHDE